MKRFFKENYIDVIGITLVISLCIVGAIFLSWYFSNLRLEKHSHVHFIDSNECYDVKSTSTYNGIVWVYFNDGSSVKVGANNVVVYVNHVCDYCGK